MLITREQPIIYCFKMASRGKIGIVGSGLIGQSWAMIFISKGYTVYLYDEEEYKARSAITNIGKQIHEFESKKILRGSLSSQEQLALLHIGSTLEECVRDTFYVQECVFEKVGLKRKIFLEIDKFVSDETVIASSTSCLLPSTFTEDLQHRAQALVAHPVNPPYFVPLVELVPAPWTSNEFMVKTRELMEEVGQKPVSLKKEVPGFLLNRIQYSILNEGYRLIEGNIASVGDIDRVMSEGLGPRYAFMGPWETAHLNARGMEEYFQKYSDGIFAVSSHFGPIPKMQGKAAKYITDSMNEVIPVETLEKRRRRRDEMLGKIDSLKKSMEK